MRGQEHPHFALKYMGADDRVVAIVFATAIENTLVKLIEGVLCDDTKEVENFLGLNGPAGSFFATSRLAYLLKIINKNTFSNLRNIAKIRNQFAHNITSEKFTNINIENLCKNINIDEGLIVSKIDSHHSDVPFSVYDLAKQYHLSVPDLESLENDPKLKYSLYCVAKAEQMRLYHAVIPRIEHGIAPL